ncbi:MAG: hypothetical protein HOP31_04755 [Ignavibacteria bacterium]|nr:hypothetical protein [Ignavibacteria bacterium]
MNDEIKRILKLLEEGKINSDQASELIDAIKEDKAVTHTGIQHTDLKDKNLKINVLKEGKNKVNLSIPLRFARAIMRATGKLPVKVHGIKEMDLNNLKAAIETGSEGRILEFKTDEGHYVEMIIG